MKGKDDDLSTARLIEFACAYSKLSKAKRFKINLKMTQMLIEGAHNLRDLLQALEFGRRLVWPYLSPYTPAAVLTLAALIVWGWAMATGAAVLWLACATLTGAAVLKIYPLIPAGESDEIE